MKIDNVNKYRSINEFRLKTSGIYCGRPSVLGNPYPITKSEEREEVIAKYKVWLWEQIKNKNEEILNELSKINEDTVLGCWCSPKHCHCEIIIKAWNWLNNKNASMEYVDG